jgi:hypothetical protein
MTRHSRTHAHGGFPENSGTAYGWPLWDAVTRGAVGAGNCYPFSPAGYTPLMGEIVFDSEGRVVDNTGIPSDTKQTWLDKLADQRWPCLAGQTIQYSCTVGA